MTYYQDKEPEQSVEKSELQEINLNEYLRRNK